eukprot:15326241-Ditylum_brightwellii.AAC.1
MVDLGGLLWASGEGLLGFFGLGAEGCLWSKLGLRCCVEDVGRWYLLQHFRGFRRVLQCSAIQRRR